MKILLFVLALMSSSAYGQYVDLDKFSLKIMRFGCNREPLTPDIECRSYTGRVATNFDLSILDHGFWRNEVHGEGTESKFMTMGWHYEIGVKFSQFEIFHEHHSRHVLDQDEPKLWNDKTQEVNNMRYPVEDSYGLRIVFYEKKK